jgi:hypothetical protein
MSGVSNTFQFIETAFRAIDTGFAVDAPCDRSVKAATISLLFKTPVRGQQPRSVQDFNKAVSANIQAVTFLRRRPGWHEFRNRTAS